MIRETRYGSRTIHFRLERRRVKSLAIRVQPAGLVEVIAPVDAEEGEICRRVARRGRWVLKQQRAFASLLALPSPAPHRSGESLRYLGRQYRLRVRHGEAQRVNLTRGSLEVTVTAGAPARDALTVVETWFSERAREKLADRFRRCAELVRPFGIRAEGFWIRHMPRRWGSCSSRGRVLLNPALVKAPTDCIDYVIVHELCHLEHHDHGAEFYRLLSRILPDWKRRKGRLERFAV